MLTDHRTTAPAGFARKQLIDVAAGRRPAETVLRGGRVVNPVSHEVVETDVAVAAGRIAGFGQYDGDVILDLGGRYICSGLFDAHVHIESSMLSVREYARAVLVRGTTTIVADPHEFANVVGLDGIRHVLDAGRDAPINVRVALSSCVPASPLESAGASLTADDLAGLWGESAVVGLAEMMNYPGVIAADPGVLAKLDAAGGRVIDGHAPSVSGRDLAAYAAAGVMSDHECITADEAAEKLRLGLHVMIREGSQTRNLDALLPLVRPETAGRFMFCTDDKDVRDLLDEGHIDYMLRRAVARGLDPILAVRLASFNTAQYFRMHDRGAVLPGRVADMAVLEDLKSFRVTEVFRDGRLVVRDGACLDAPEAAADDPRVRNTVRVHDLSLDDFAVPVGGNGDAGRLCIHVIHVLENRIDTERSVEPATVRDGRLVADAARDLAKMVVLERHRASGRVGRGFVRGFKLNAGAIGSSVAHDAHNLIVVGMNDADMLAAARRMVELQGGLVVVRDGRVLAEVPLPLAGLVSDQPAAVAADQLRRLADAARDLGCRLEQPFMALSFLSLSVIGKLKLTDQGLIDVEAFRPIPLIEPT